MSHRLRTAALVVGTGAVLAAVAGRLRERSQRDATTRPAVEVAHPPRAVVRASNPVVRWMLASPRRMGGAGDALLLLHVTGRRTGAVYDVPVGYHPADDGRLTVVTDAGWRVNLRGRPDVEVTLKGVRRAARAELVEDPDVVAGVYESLLDEEDPRGSARRLGLRLAQERVPDHEDLAKAGPAGAPVRHPPRRGRGVPAERLTPGTPPADAGPTTAPARERPHRTPRSRNAACRASRPVVPTPSHAVTSAVL